MKSTSLYRKEGRKYVPVYEYPRLYADGVWLVMDQGNSKKHILHIGELTELYPFAQMMQSSDTFASWLCHYSADKLHGSMDWNPETGFLTYSFGTASDTAKDILKFLSMTESEQKFEIERLVNENTYIDSDGAVRDARGKLIHWETSHEAINANIAALEEKIARLKARRDFKPKS